MKLRPPATQHLGRIVDNAYMRDCIGYVNMHVRKKLCVCVCVCVHIYDVALGQHLGRIVDDVFIVALGALTGNASFRKD